MKLSDTMRSQDRKPGIASALHRTKAITAALKTCT
jgi:hypothetical protein